MPKGMGYDEVGKASKMGFFSRKKKKRKQKYTKATERVLKRLQDAGLSREEAESRVDPAARKAARRG